MADEQQSDTRLEHVPVEKLENNIWNPNRMEQEAFDRLVAEIQDVGFIDALQVIPQRGGTYRIIGGEHRAAAARELKLKTVPAVILDGPRWQEEDLQKLVTVRLNMLKGKIDPAKMAVLYNEMATKYGEDALQNLFAFTDRNAWDMLLTDIKQGLASAGVPPDKRKEFDKKVKEAKTLKDLERILNELWSSYGDTVHLSFMVFTYGSREHFYVQMNKATRKAVRQIAKHCKGEGTDINDVVGPAMVALAELLVKKKAGKKVQPKQDDVAF